MTTLTSALNYGAFITLSCCNAILQIAAAPECIDPARDSFWPSCAPDGGGNPETGREWRLDGDRVCLHYDPGSQPETECAAVAIHRGKLYLVAGAGQRRPVDSIGWRAG